MPTDGKTGLSNNSSELTEDEFLEALKKASQPTDQVEDLEDEDG